MLVLDSLVCASAGVHKQGKRSTARSSTNSRLEALGVFATPLEAGHAHDRYAGRRTHIGTEVGKSPTSSIISFHLEPDAYVTLPDPCCLPQWPLVGRRSAGGGEAEALVVSPP